MLQVFRLFSPLITKHIITCMHNFCKLFFFTDFSSDYQCDPMANTAEFSWLISSICITLDWTPFFFSLSNHFWEPPGQHLWLWLPPSYSASPLMLKQYSLQSWQESLTLWLCFTLSLDPKMVCECLEYHRPLVKIYLLPPPYPCSLQGIVRERGGILFSSAFLRVFPQNPSINLHL